MSKTPEEPTPARTTRPPKSEVADAEGWKSSAQTQRLLHELRVHQIELEMQNEELRVSRGDLESSLKRYTDLFDFAPVGYLTVSREGLLRELNLPAARMLGRERSRLVGGRLRTFISERARFAFDHWLEQVFTEPERLTCDVVLLRDNLPPLSVQLEAKLSSDGQLGRVTMTDITSRKALEQELRQAQKMEAVGQLAGGVAHDFNNILAAMQLNLGLLRAEGASPEGQAALGSLDALAKRAASLTSQLLLFSRRQVLQRRPLELNGLVTQLLEMLERLLGEEIVCSFQPGAPEVWVEADAAMLEQAVMNLCLNARDAMPRGGELSLATSVVELDAHSLPSNPKFRPGRFASLQVMDTGVGIAPDVVEHVFEPFFTTKEVGRGTGLGLASVYGTVSQHHGWLKVDSRVGHGTTFRLYLPESPKPRAASAPPKSLRSTMGKGETVLLVEDEPALLAVAARSLTRLGYRVLTAADGPQSLGIWEQHASDIDLLFTDMRMPGGMDGLALAERLSASKPSLKIIVMSGYSSDMVANNAKSRVKFSYLAKPFELDTLAATVRRCLDEPHV